MKKLLLSAAAIISIGAADAARASSIDTLSAWDGSTGIGSFGGGGATGVYGETFTAPGNLTSFTFEVDTGSDLNTVAQVYAWSGAVDGGNGAQGAVGPALFTSAPITIAGTGIYQAVTVNTGNLALTPGMEYVALLADTGGDYGDASFGLDGYYSHPGVAGDGGFDFYNNDYTLASINANNWGDFADLGSLAWHASFADAAAAVPEPGSLLLIGAGIGGLGMVRRRRA